MKIVSSDGQLSFDNMDVAPIKVGGCCTLEDRMEQSYRAMKLASDMSHTYYNKPVVIAFSGGKDSQVILQIAEECLGNDFEVINSHTTVDFPETVKLIEREFDRLRKNGVNCYYKNRYPVKDTMWDLIVYNKMPPTRLAMYCCTRLKETGTKNRLVVLGVRAAESSNRQGREIFGIRGKTKADSLFFSLDHAEEVHRESQEINDAAWDCKLIEVMKEHKDTTVSPIYGWSDSDVWDFIKDRGIQVNPMYEHFRRIGCILCPLATKEERLKQIELFPMYKKAYINAFEEMLKQDGFKPRDNWKTGEDVFNWWVQFDDGNIAGQISMFEESEETK